MGSNPKRPNLLSGEIELKFSKQSLRHLNIAANNIVLFYFIFYIYSKK